MSRPLRVCLVYDCVYPHTVGGAERWYRELAGHLVVAGHEVTYLSRLQWDPQEGAGLPGVDVVAVSRREPLYGPDGQRLPGPPVRFGWGVAAHLLRHRRRYDVVHTCGFPYFPVLAVRLALAGVRRRRPMVLVEWVEVWSTAYWRRYLGPVGGAVGALVQRACVVLTPVAVSHSRLHARRLRAWGYRGPEPVVLAGLYSPTAPGPAVAELPDGDPMVLYAGRHIAEKRVPLLVDAFVEARRRLPGLRLLVLGDGPERAEVRSRVAAAGLDPDVVCPGFVAAEELGRAMRSAACLVLPSEREGHGMVVVEAASHGTPVVVVAGEDNAATELVEPGVNGAVAPVPTAQALAGALLEVVEGGTPLRARTAAWFEQRGARGTAAASAAQVLDLYGRAAR